MIEFEDSGIDEEEEEISKSSKLAFKFEFQTETVERLRREGCRSLSDSGESSFLASSPAFSTAAKKYETPSPAKNLTFVIENPKAGTFRVEDCLKEKKREKTEDYPGDSGESLSGFMCSSSSSSPVISTAAKKYESPFPAKNLTFVIETPKAATSRVEKTEDYSVSSALDKKENSEKIRFLTEDDFLESDSDFVDSSQTFTSNEDGFLSDSDFGETSPPEEKEQNRQNTPSSGSEEEEEDDTNGFESLWEHQDLIEQLKMEMKKIKAIGGLPTIREEEEDDCPKIMEELKPWRIEEEKKFKHVDY